MRISDWSSDVCSSDLAEGGDAARQRRGEHLLDGVLDVGGGDFLAVVEPDAALQRPADLRLADDLELLGEGGPDVQVAANGRASCRDRVCQYGSISWVAVSLKQKTDKYKVL